MTGEILHLRTGFDSTWRGFRRGQVRRYVQDIETELELVVADRDAMVESLDRVVAELESARGENRELRQRLDRVCRTPIDLAGTSERLRHMVELASDEAAEITGRARAAAERSWSVIRDAEAAHRRRHEWLIADLKAQREQAETAHRASLRRTHEVLAVLTAQAEKRRHELDVRAERLREQIKLDFDLAMSVRRSEAVRAHAEEERAAREHAERIVRVAEQRVSVLMGHHDRVAASLRSVGQVLAGAHTALGTITPAGRSADGRPPAGLVPDRTQRHAGGGGMATLTIWRFDSAVGADDAAKQLADLAKREVIEIHDAAVVSWPLDRKKPKIRQVKDLRGRAALTGAFWGTLLGLLFLVPVLGAAVGAATGALTANLGDFGIDDDLVKETRDKVTPGTSALFLLSSGAVIDKVRHAFAGGTPPELLYTNLSTEQEKVLREVFADD
ncbi:DUF1269 domain-containing protein [Actinokineospora globicatena]|uniref:DUF1269 domain-containing protein n=1 Tax=Actinokineospora globicatena TaxID=103729 RepID=UPI0027E28930|nr:DUF1269 domain-containing protein [Actinokineospora globicatena]MCP2303431.1 putative membrane protein [Actinokineospora globicatena]GLW79435.1 hypothetical protein Aglo01_39170 [Actinokineospora globicatena]GLW86155.1 hypothetical protein Aglo02_37940 [Actinokineospora globicatena]